MKELTIEQKAKAYDKALERARRLYNGEETNADVEIACENIFPELKEIEDERIRKEIIEMLRNWASVHHITKEQFSERMAWLEKKGMSYTKKDVDEAYLKGVTDAKNEIEKQYEANYQIRKDIATFLFNYRSDIKDRAKWMNYLGVSFVEKQDEQKYTDKVKPKFKVGDWVIDKQNIVHQIANVIENVTNHTYGYDIVGGGYFNDNTEGVRLWTIQDAKDGDVLSAHECNVIFKEIDGLNIKCYCTHHYLGLNPIFYIDTLQNKDAFHPATKEQRDALMKAMKEVGYEWDADKKELKKEEIK